MALNSQLILLFTIIVSVLSQQEAETDNTWTGADVPNPSVDPAACGVTADSSICDPDNLIVDVARDQLQDTIDTVQQQINNISDYKFENYGQYVCENETERVRFLVVLVDKIQQVKDDDQDIISFSDGVRKAWGLDKAGCQNYVLITSSNDRRLVFVKSGQNVPKSVDSLSTDGPRAESLALFNDRQNAAGAADMVVHVYDLINEENSVSRSSAVVSQAGIGGNDDNERWWLRIIIFASVVAACVILLALFGWMMYTGYDKGRATGKWNVIPINVKRVSAPGTSVYPDYVSTISRTVKTTRSTSTDAVNYGPESISSGSPNGYYSPPTDRSHYYERSPSPIMQGQQQLPRAPPPSTPPMNNDHLDQESLEEGRFFGAEPEAPEQTARVAHLVARR